MTPFDIVSDDDVLDFSQFADKPPDLAPREKYTAAGKVTRAFHDSRALIRLLRGPVGCGKTFASWREIFVRAFFMPVGDDGWARTKVWACRRTYGDLKRGTVESFWLTLPRRWADEGVFNKTEMTYRLETTIRRYDKDVKMSLVIEFLPLDRDRALGQFKGGEFNVLYLNEAVEMNAMALQMGLSRLGRYHKDLPPEKREDYVILDTNSFDPAHPLYPFFYVPEVITKNARTAKMEPEAFLAVFDYPSGLSPDAENLANLPADFYEKKCAGQSQQYIDVMIKNKFGAVADGRPCYPAFRADIHASEYIAPNKDLPIFCGVDFGRDPAVVVCQENEDGSIVVIDAEYRLKTEGATGIREMYGIFAARYPAADGWRWVEGGHDPGGAAMTQVVDISPVQFALSMARHFGVCGTGKAWSNNPNDRIDVVNRMLSDIGAARVPALRISYDRTNKGLLYLVRAMSKYQYAKVKGQTGMVDRHHDKPDKDDVSHIAEALQYALLRPNGGAREKMKFHPGQKKAQVEIKPLAISPFART